jgi:hypothetical protein
MVTLYHRTTEGAATRIAADARNAGSQNSEIVRSIRKRMDSEKQPERAAG